MNWDVENSWFDKGYTLICGCDEAGRGPLAGPVFAAAVILPKGLVIEGLNDSKKLSEKKREALFDHIISKADDYHIAFATVEEIEEINILNASMLAMRRSIEGLKSLPDMALIDGNIARDFPCQAVPVIKGDAKSPSIAAASILAKVSRDRICREMHRQYPEYGFDAHKGYGTKAHYDAIKKHGITPLHRKSFLKKLLGE